MTINTLIEELNPAQLKAATVVVDAAGVAAAVVDATAVVTGTVLAGLETIVADF